MSVDGATDSDPDNFNDDVLVRPVEAVQEMRRIANKYRLQQPVKINWFAPSQKYKSNSSHRSSANGHHHSPSSCTRVESTGSRRTAKISSPHGCISAGASSSNQQIHCHSTKERPADPDPQTSDPRTESLEVPRLAQTEALQRLSVLRAGRLKRIARGRNGSQNQVGSETNGEKEMALLIEDGLLRTITSVLTGYYAFILYSATNGERI